MRFQAAPKPPFPIIQCVQCGKPVDRIKWWNDPSTDATSIQVWCHGATETKSLPGQVQIELGFGSTIVEAKAFENKRLLDIKV